MMADTALAEARWNLSELVAERRVDSKASAQTLDQIVQFLEIIGPDMYSTFADSAVERISGRDPDDWPTLALSLALSCPIWTEDRDFFGVGVATWITRHVEIFLRGETSEPAE